MLPFSMSNNSYVCQKRKHGLSNVSCFMLYSLDECPPRKWMRHINEFCWLMCEGATFYKASCQHTGQFRGASCVFSPWKLVIHPICSKIAQIMLPSPNALMCGPSMQNITSWTLKIHMIVCSHTCFLLLCSSVDWLWMKKKYIVNLYSVCSVDSYLFLTGCGFSSFR